jgi:hypothetical protein
MSAGQIAILVGFGGLGLAGAATIGYGKFTDHRRREGRFKFSHGTENARVAENQYHYRGMVNRAIQSIEQYDKTVDAVHETAFRDMVWNLKSIMKITVQPLRFDAEVIATYEDHGGKRRYPTLETVLDIIKKFNEVVPTKIAGKPTPKDLEHGGYVATESHRLASAWRHKIPEVSSHDLQQGAVVYLVSSLWATWFSDLDKANQTGQTTINSEYNQMLDFAKQFQGEEVAMEM